ncbi:Phosphonate-transporting ATPase [Solidesulfovibrio carbinoliphilus subsp. oakridgensis]|uniref:Phosphonate-transporting ATPase n=1 Tax=Solidesulfovibrio carbinoliphilus subsp. oakridgensis TaxID=694327 RepID=G7QDS8_9BACT|nr:ABC transporter ATP-binding protein [Solidesulfovibrio carbinoliphilus]EHJ46584.1 Phosphonate-transporting ATPase [Solidesulfovibrio carbinoliphilus subsp. oakridgensis]
MLEITDIHTYYGNIQALRGVSLRIGAGEIVTLIGANGAGKTTTLMSISGVTPPKRGTVSFLGQDVTRLSTERIVSLGITQVPEGRMIFPRLTVKENLLMGGYLRRDKAGIRADEEKVYGLFPVLFERRTQMGGTLSGGEQQMLAIGRALLARPKLLLLDEPSLGLAPLVVENIFEIIKQINADGVTVLLVEQNAQMALHIAHRAYVLETGRITLEGAARDLLNDPKVRSAYLGLD